MVRKMFLVLVLLNFTILVSGQAKEELNLDSIYLKVEDVFTLFAFTKKHPSKIYSKSIVTEQFNFSTFLPEKYGDFDNRDAYYKIYYNDINEVKIIRKIDTVNHFNNFELHVTSYDKYKIYSGLYFNSYKGLKRGEKEYVTGWGNSSIKGFFITDTTTGTILSFNNVDHFLKTRKQEAKSMLVNIYMCNEYLYPIKKIKISKGSPMYITYIYYDYMGGSTFKEILYLFNPKNDIDVFNESIESISSLFDNKKLFYVGELSLKENNINYPLWLSN